MATQIRPTGLSGRRMKEPLTIQSAADFFRTARASRAFIVLLHSIQRLFSFTRERTNRLRRCLEIIRLYAAGVPIRDIINRWGCSSNTVLRYARAAGLPKREKGYPEKIRLAALALYKEGKSLDEIQAALGISQGYISRLATENNINRNRRITEKDRAAVTTLYAAGVPVAEIMRAVKRDRRTISRIAKRAGLKLRKGES